MSTYNISYAVCGWPNTESYGTMGVRIGRGAAETNTCIQSPVRFRIWSPVRQQQKLKVKETNIPTNKKNDYQVPIIDNTTDYSSSLNQMLLAKQRAHRPHSDES